MHNVDVVGEFWRHIETTVSCHILEMFKMSSIQWYTVPCVVMSKPFILHWRSTSLCYSHIPKSLPSPQPNNRDIPVVVHTHLD